MVTVGPLEIGVFNVGGELRAYRNACPHAGAPVCVGRIARTLLPSRVYEYLYGKEGFILRCPWHGWEFDLRTGEHVVDPRVRLKSCPAGARQEGGSRFGPPGTERRDALRPAAGLSEERRASTRCP